MAEKQVSDHTPIACLQENPKRKGSQAHERYEKYKSAKTVGEALQLGAVKGDIPNDLKKGHIKVVEGVEAGGQAAAPHLPSAAGQEPVASSSSASPVKRGVVEVAGAAADCPAAKRQAVQIPALSPLRPAEPSPAVKPMQPVQPVEPVQPAQPPQLPAAKAAVSAVDSSAGAAVDVSSEAASTVSSATLAGTVSTPQDTVPTPQGRKIPYEADLSFAKLDGKPMKFVKRVMGEAKKLLSERGLGESKSEGLHFSLKDRDNLSKYAVTVRDLNQDGKLYKDLERLGLDASIDLELSLPDGYPLSPPFARVVYPQLTGGFVFQHGGICFEPLTEKGWAPSMTLPSLCIAIKAILDFGDVRVAGPGNKELRSVQGYTEDGARKDSQMISRAHNGGDSRTYQNVKNLKS